MDMGARHVVGLGLTLTLVVSPACGGDDGESSETPSSSTSGDGDGDASTTGEGDGDASTTGDGDGDPTTTGDGDGDPTTTGDGDGDGDGDTGDPECAAPTEPFMSYCNVPEPKCPSDYFCFLHQAEAGNVNAFIGYCSPECETEADCVWGSEGQCSDPDIVCATPQGASQARCMLSCVGDEDCYPGQFCHGAYGLCIPMEP
jgi:hypothetical protein